MKLLGSKLFPPWSSAEFAKSAEICAIRRIHGVEFMVQRRRKYSKEYSVRVRVLLSAVNSDARKNLSRCFQREL